MEKYDSPPHTHSQRQTKNNVRIGLKLIASINDPPSITTHDGNKSCNCGSALHRICFKHWVDVAWYMDCLCMGFSSLCETAFPTLHWLYLWENIGVQCLAQEHATCRARDRDHNPQPSNWKKTSLPKVHIIDMGCRDIQIYTVPLPVTQWASRSISLSYMFFSLGG